MDRLEEIKNRHKKALMIDYVRKDFKWLISETERLRMALEFYNRTDIYITSYTFDGLRQPKIIMVDKGKTAFEALKEGE